MSELNDSIHKAEQNASISLEDYCSDLAKPQKPKKKKQMFEGICNEKAPEMSKKFLIGLIVGAVILGVVALPSYTKAFGSLGLYGTSNIVFLGYLIAAIGATGGGLFLLIWGGVNKHKVDKIHADGEKKLSLINAKDEEERVAEIKNIDEEYERELARYQFELNKYRESLSQRKVDYDEFIASNSRFISSCRAEYAKIGEECFPNHYQDFVDIQALVSIASAHPFVRHPRGIMLL